MLWYQTLIIHVVLTWYVLGEDYRSDTVSFELQSILLKGLGWRLCLSEGLYNLPYE